jgi:ribonuclease P protein component
MSSPSVRNGSSRPSVSPGDYRFPKSRRLTKRTEFQGVYEEGAKVHGAYFVVFCRRSGGKEPSRVGFTLPRRLGKAVVRNRARRRLRELVRLHWPQLPDGYELVFHVRQPIVKADKQALEAEIRRVFQQVARDNKRRG